MVQEAGAYKGILINIGACSDASLLCHKFHISQGNRDEMTQLYLGQIKSDLHKIFNTHFFLP